MNDSGFELSGIRQMLLQVTGINILGINKYQENVLNQDEDQIICIQFTSTSYPGKVYKMNITQSELNKISKSDLTSFKIYFEKFASTTVG